MRALTLSLCLFLTVSAQTALAQEKRAPEKCLVENCLIKAGVGLENIVAGQSVIGDAVARFGRDYELIEHNKYSYEVRYRDLGLSFYYLYGDQQKKVFAIEVRPPFKAVTESGIVLGKSTLAEVEKKYWPSDFSTGSGSDTYSFDYPGIQFHVEADKSLVNAGYGTGKHLQRRIVAISVEAIKPAPPAVEIQSSPIKVSGGPLLFFRNSEEVAGKRKAFHYVIDPEADTTPKLFLTSADDYKPWHRFSQDEFLMGSSLIPTELFFLNLKTGAAHHLLEGGLINLYKVDGDKVFFLEQEHSDRGFAPNAEKTLAKRPQSRHTRYRLYVFDRTSPAHSTLVTEEALLHLLAIDEEYCWVIVDRPRPELWRISRDKREQKKITEIQDKWLFSLKSAASSPDGSLLALGVNDSKYAERRTLLVLDVATGKTVFKSTEINVLESGERTFQPDLKLVWLDNERVRFSETAKEPGGSYFFQWVDLNIRTGKRLNEKRYSEIAYEHQMPSKDSLEYREPGDTWTDGLFVRKLPHLLYFKGDAAAVADLSVDGYSTSMLISEDGEWAVFAGPKTGAYLADGVKKTKNRLAISGIDFAWMPPRKAGP